MELILIGTLNLIATLFTVFWLTEKAKRQREIIEDQSRKLTDLEKYTNLFKQLTEMVEPENVLKLLETEKRIMKQDNEVVRRKQIQIINEQLSKEWSTVYEKRIVPIYNGIVKEFSNFIIHYLEISDFRNKDERNGFIREYFPENAEMLISYFERPEQAPNNDTK